METSEDISKTKKQDTKLALNVVATKNNTDAINNKINSSKNLVATIKEENNSKKHHSKLSLFAFGKKIYQRSTSAKTSNSEELSKQTEKDKNISSPSSTPSSPKIYVKKTSLGRMISSNTNIPKKIENEKKKIFSEDRKFHTFGGRRNQDKLFLERFTSLSKDDSTSEACTENSTAVLIRARNKRNHFGSCDELDNAVALKKCDDTLSSKTIGSLSRSLGKLFWKRTDSVDISAPDPEFKVSYLGNVLASWAKGENCVEKQLATLWRNYTQNQKPDVMMRIKVCASGLKATTQQHGLTEYWANRITHCCAPKNYPRVFCWVYRHEGRKLKHELRCHAVLCSKEKMVQDMCYTLKENLESALREFKREKLLKQNARLSLANAAYDNPSLPRRKILLSVGCNNYRPPLERSKSAPKLMAIEESIGENDEDEVEETNEPEMKSCCQKDSLYPAMTLGRRRCRRGHSIRRTGKTRTKINGALHDFKLSNEVISSSACTNTENEQSFTIPADATKAYNTDDFDDFEKLLQYSHYDANASLANEVLPFLDIHLPKSESSDVCNFNESSYVEEHLNPSAIVNSHPNADNFTEINLTTTSHEHNLPTNILVAEEGNSVNDFLAASDDYQDIILNLLHRESMRHQTLFQHNCDKSAPSSLTISHQAQSSISSNASSVEPLIAAHNVEEESNALASRKLVSQDSDEGSISSGCETASTITNNLDDISLKYIQGKQQGTSNGLSSAQDVRKQHSNDLGIPMLDNSSSIALQTYQRFDACQKNQETLNEPALDSFETPDSSELNMLLNKSEHMQSRYSHHQILQNQDSDCSDESGYGELQERDKIRSKKRISNCSFEMSTSHHSSKLQPS